MTASDLNGEDEIVNPYTMCWVFFRVIKRILSAVSVAHVQGVHEVFEMSYDLRWEIFAIFLSLKKKINVGVDLFNWYLLPILSE